MKTLFKLIFFFVFMGIVFLPVALVVLSIEKKALVDQPLPLTFDKVNRVKKLVDQIRPDRFKKRQIQAFQINESDLNLLVDYALSQGLKSDNVFADITLQKNHALVEVTMTLPSTPMGDYLNLRLDVQNKGALVNIASVKAGYVFIPGAMVNPVLGFFHNRGLANDGYQSLMENIESIKSVLIQQGLVRVVYDWNPASLARLQERSKNLFLPPDHQERLIFYMNQLQAVLLPYANKRVSLAKILPPMFERASVQSTKSNDPVWENIAVFQILALYANGTNLSQFVGKPLQKNIKPRVRARLMLKSRFDLPKHFLISAGLAVSAGSRMANFIGLAKEVDDSDGGSGFSFADLAADRAGVRLAEQAVSSEQSAVRLQSVMKAIQMESDFMPSIDRLPERIMALEFKKKYNDLDSKTYALVNDEIDRRIQKCIFFQ